MDIRRSSKKLCAKVIAFALTAIILMQSGMTAYAAQDIPGRGLGADGIVPDSTAPTAQEDADGLEKPSETGSAGNSGQDTDTTGQDGSGDADSSDPSGEDVDLGEENSADTSEKDKESGNADDAGNAGESGDAGNSDDADSDEKVPDDPGESDEDGDADSEDSEQSKLSEEDEKIGEELEDSDEDSGQKKLPAYVKLIERESHLRREEPIEQLTEEQIAVLDEELAQAAEQITPEIIIEDEKILFAGELGYADGYYLAFRINPDMEQFTENGTIRITYLDGDDEEVCYESPESVWQDGFWDVIMPYPEDCRDMTMEITVDNDGENGNNGETEASALDTVGGIDGEIGEAVDTMEEKIVYLPTTYYVDLSGIVTMEPEEVSKDELPADLMAEGTPENDGAVIDMTAPVIKKITTRDTTAVLKFTPNDVVRSVTGEKDAKGGRGYYTLTLTDKVTGKEIETVNTADIPAETKAAATCTYSLSIGTDSTETAPLYTCEIQGLLSNKTYAAILTAHYDYGEGGGEPLVKPSKSMNFTTKKVMLTTGGSLDVSYVSMEALRANPNAAGSKIGDGIDPGVKEVSLDCNKPYALFAEVTNLSRALETEKLKWTIQVVNDDGTKKTADKKSATLKAGVSTYEVQLELTAPGRYIVTAVSTVNKETLAEFVVNASQPAGGDNARLSLQSELFYFYEGSKGDELL